MADVQPFDLLGPSPRALGILFLIVVVSPLAVTLLALAAAGGGLSRAPGPMAIGVVAAVSLVAYAVLAAAATRSDLTVSPEGLRVRSTFYTVFVERSAVRVAEIRAGDSTRDAACMLTLRTNGMSMPGFHSGWFRTGTAERAFVAKAGPNCVLVPTDKGFLIILGARDAEMASRAIRASLS